MLFTSLHRNTLSKYKRALAFAIAALVGSTPSIAAASSADRPAPYRFAKTVLSQGEFFEPTEMAILPNLDILIGQRRGEILHYDHQEKEIYRVGFLDVYSSSDAPGVNAEEGLLGMTADPDFAQNNYIYIFYSPAEKSVNRLSRFVFKNRQLDLESEKIVLEFYSQRDICCHTGGSLAFGPDRLLYLSTGDNSTPFDERGAEFATKGFAPLNDLPDKEQYDARRTAGNTNDLRGKILRIRVLPDGSYEIPEGNLFPATDQTRPEIFTMGHRNPYRISVDPENGDLYWGDVGPDATKDDAERGPRGYDEMNRATQAGNFGWPFFIGDNFPYRDFDYGTGESGAAFDPQSPVNDSANNTGLRELPPAQPPFIWYPYAESSAFPELGSGGRNAMAGPVYHKERYPEETRLPDYYDDKVVMYDWIRNRFVAVAFGTDGDVASIEPILEELEFSGPIDVEMGPDGRLYVLEYGEGWFQKNQDSGLSRIDFIEGNLPPVIESVSVEKSTGKTPLPVNATVQATDHEGEPMAYTWNIADAVFETDEPRLSTELATPGAYELTVTATDPEGARSTSKPLALYAGNEQPLVEIAIEGNQSFYFPDTPVNYRVAIEDDAALVESNAFLSASMEQRAPTTAVGHLVVSPAEEGKALAAASDCAACHKPDAASIGPAFVEVARRYANEPNPESRLSNSILNGSSGTWGPVAMPAHPSFSESELSKVVAWVLSHQPADAEEASLPLEGSIDASELVSDRWRQQLVIKARYRDQPAPNLLPLSASDAVALRPSKLNRFAFEDEGFAPDGINLAYVEQDAELKLERVDLSGIDSITLTHDRPVKGPLTVSVHWGGPNEHAIAHASVQDQAETRIHLDTLPDGPHLRDLTLRFAFEQRPQEEALLQTVAFSQRSRSPIVNPNPVISPEVHADGKATFRLQAPNASKVELSGQFQSGNEPMEKGEDGVWSITVGPIEPDLYPYNFVVDGVGMNDPRNQYIFPNEGFKPSLVDVPSDPPSLHAARDVPHGKVSYHFYDSEIVGETRPFLVYTPPGYEKSRKDYPVFYLVSGTTDTEETFFKAGRANFILDNLIAAGKAKPMIIVMPYGNMKIGTPRPHTPEAAKMYDLFAEVLVGEIMPIVESTYRTKNKRESRAIAGFSRGGGQSLFTGFKHIDKFAHIASFSAYLTPEVFDSYFAELLENPDTTNKRLKLLWFGVGRSDFLYEPAITFVDYLESNGIERHSLVTDGGHTWMNARHYLAETLPLLFK